MSSAGKAAAEDDKWEDLTPEEIRLVYGNLSDYRSPDGLIHEVPYAFINGKAPPGTRKKLNEYLKQTADPTKEETKAKPAIAVSIVTCQRCRATQSRDVKLDARFKHCGGCYVARYCSPDCQKAHWPTHKTDCLFQQKIDPDKLAAKRVDRFMYDYWNDERAVAILKTKARAAQELGHVLILCLDDCFDKDSKDVALAWQVAATKAMMTKQSEFAKILNAADGAEMRDEISKGSLGWYIYHMAIDHPGQGYVSSWMWLREAKS